MTTHVPDKHADPGLKMAKKAAFSGCLGSTIEYFDFVAFATSSALVFNHLFFSGLGEKGSIIASFATFGVAYVTRPLGAIVFGTLGDRVGRSRTLIYTLVLMGVATFCVGCLPTAEQIGSAAAILLVICRLAQGLSAGGEQAGSNALIAEHAPQDKRGLYTGWTMVGVVIGTTLGSAVFIPITAIGQDFLLGFGWRIPFLLAGPLALFTLYIRKQVRETDAFKAVKNATREHVDDAQTLEKVPVVAVIRDYWPALLRIIVCSLYALTGSMLSVFSINYATHYQNLNSTTLLSLVTVIMVITIPLAPLWAAASDTIGRRPVFIISVLGLAVTFPILFWTYSLGNYVLIFIVMLILAAISQGGNIVQAPMYTEMFPTKVRYTGYAIGTQVGLLIVGFSPTIAAAIVKTGSDGWIPVAAFIVVCMILAAISAFTAKETKGMSIAQIDER